jgi:hypothetical protein
MVANGRGWNRNSCMCYSVREILTVGAVGIPSRAFTAGGRANRGCTPVRPGHHPTRTGQMAQGTVKWGLGGDQPHPRRRHTARGGASALSAGKQPDVHSLTSLEQGVFRRRL